MHSFIAFTTFIASVLAQGTTVPSGALTVGDGGDYSTVSEAVAALDTSTTDAQTIFIYAGTYEEQVYIPELAGPLTVYGYTEDTSSYTGNTVTITAGKGLVDEDDDDETATVRNWSPNSSFYNLNIENTYGEGSQALALSAYATNQGYYGVGLYGYQDTLLAETGNQVYAQSYIEGAVDFIFGQEATAWFDSCTIAVIREQGTITASGRPSEDSDSYYVINKSTVQAADGYDIGEGTVYLGRPWSEYARVAFQYTEMSDVIASVGWEEWSTSEPNTEYVTLAEYDNSGEGCEGTRASFATTLSEAIDITDILGSDYADWVDTSYLSS